MYSSFRPYYPRQSKVSRQKRQKVSDKDKSLSRSRMYRIFLMPQCFKLPPYPGFKYLPEFNETRIIQCRTLICLKLYETTMTSSEIMHRLVFLPLIPGKPIPSNAIPVSIPSGKYFEESITPTDVSIPWPYNVNKKQYEFIHRFYPGSFLARHLPLPSCSGRTAGCIW